MRRNGKRLCVLAALAGTQGIAATIASAATDQWTGASSNLWSDAGNWTGGNAPPLSGDSLLFTGTSPNTSTSNNNGNLPVVAITFNAGADAYTLGGPNGITLLAPIDAGNGTTAGGISSSATNTQIISLAQTWAAGKHIFSTAGTGALNFSGAVTRNSGATAVFAINTGAINLTGSGLTKDSSDAGGILGGWAVLGGNGPSNVANSNNFGDYATLDGSGNVVAYTGYTPITTGAITSSATANLKYSSDTAAITAGTVGTDVTLLNTILATLSTANRTLTINGALKLGSANPGGRSAGIYRTATPAAGNITFTLNGGSLTANGGGEITLADSTNNAGLSGFAATNNNLTIGTTVVADDGANVVSVNILGYAVMNAANTYTGGTTITQGRAQMGNANAMGPNNSNITVFPGAQAFLNANSVFTYNWFLSGFGSTENNGLGAIRAGTGKTVAGAITLVTDAAIGGGNGVPTVTASITGPGGLRIGHGNNNNGSGNIHFGDGTGTQLYTYQGDTIINDNANTANTFFINTGSNNLLPHGANRGNFIINATSAANNGILDLNGTTQTINGLNSGGATPVNASVISSAAGGALTVGDNNAGGSFAGVISTANLALFKIGTGTQVLSGANTYGGNTTVSGGKLNVTGSLANNSSSKVFVADDPDTVFGTSDDVSIARAVATTYSIFGSTEVGALTSSADLRQGLNSRGAGTGLTMQWRARSVAESTGATPLLPTASSRLVSDVFNLTGMVIGGGASGQTDVYALQMTYDEPLVTDEAAHASSGELYLGWLDTSVTEWKNAIANDVGVGGSAVANFQGSYSTFAAANTITDANVGDFLGSWGVDTTFNTAWAIVNHNSQFSVVMVPEPAAGMITLLATTALTLHRRRRRSK